MERKVELLAPAGNMEGFYGAIHAGADAVYLGGDRFGARAYADNFTQEELLACIRYAHIWGRRVYLTVNTLVKEIEFYEIDGLLRPLYEAGLDGVIIQDIGVFCYIRDHFPGLKLHVSTQMTLTSRYGVALLKRLGADRIVPARELNLEEIKQMKSMGIEIETFIHGAMCYCYSGQCLFSSMLGGRSGNRGRCAQPCRLPYQVRRGERVTGECYPLSLKDICTAEHISELIEAGIDSFKIEGRMKKPEYAAGVTAIYRKYIDRYYAGEDCAISSSDMERLASLYIRSERQDGYYHKHNGRDMVSLDNPAYCGSDEKLLTEIRKKYIDAKPVMKVRIDAEFKIGQPAKVMFALLHEGILTEVPMLKAPISDSSMSDSPALEISVSGEPVAVAQKQPVTKENILNQLGKLGNTSFEAEEINVLLDEGAFYSLKAINELRRLAVCKLEDAIIRNSFTQDSFAEQATVEKITDSFSKGQEDIAHGVPGWNIAVMSKEQLAAVAEYVDDVLNGKPGQRPARIYLEADLAVAASTERDMLFYSCCENLKLAGCELALSLPYILRAADEAWLEQLWAEYKKSDMFFGFLVRSMDGMGFLWEKLRESNSETEETNAQSPMIYGDAGLYVWNRKTMHALYGLDGFCMPYELNAGDQRLLMAGRTIPCEKVVYGRIPLMITANCVAKTVDGCRRDSTEAYFLTDRYKKDFPVCRNCTHCYNVIYNSVPLSLHESVEKWRSMASLRLQFTVENKEETKKILRYFLSGAEGRPSYEYTTGHEKRGAE